MKKTNNIEFELLLQDEEFIHLMNVNPLKAEQLIEDLCRENPGKEVSIRLAAQLMRHYQAEKIEVGSKKITMMWDNILRKSEAKKSTRFFRMAPIWRIAASVAILLSVTFYFFEYWSNNSIRKFADQQISVGNDARIIISDGSEYRLTSNNSHIKYDADGKKIVIEDKIGLTERLNNGSKDAKSVYNQIVVPYGRRHSITLSDGTIVQLNSGSKLVFPAKFAVSKREVFLKGEGYFEVAKNTGKPFIVKTDFMNVKVLGTHFNVSAYENEKSATAVLVEGSVEVYNNNFFNNHRCKIKPGQGCFFTENVAGFKIQNVDVNEYVSWKNGYYQFKDQTFDDIVKKIEKYYNKTIAIADDELIHRMISGKLVLEPKFEKTMNFLARTTKSRYIQKENGVYIFLKTR
ncbi:MAG: FecR family protein [Bacteroidota bacterium]|nr:FecR family protein [Bacteroidota bacterium]